jgi:Zn-dependent M32 family carboxypeptidase
VIRAFGYDYTRGRQDKTAHPFMTKLGRGDVRITTRYSDDFLPDGLFSTLHEAGHAMYEQGIADELEGTPLFSGTTAGVHESQSRLWENLVGRSLPFWSHWYGSLQAAFPASSTTCRWIRSIARSTRWYRRSIRTEADEVTYNLHVMLRFDLELALLEGTLKVADLPEAWRERVKSDLGVSPPDDRDGALQDVHWYGGIVGGRVPELYARQHHERAILRRGAPRSARSRPSRSARENSRRCASGSRPTSTGTAASSPRPTLSSARRASRSRSRPISTISIPNTARCTGL